MKKKYAYILLVHTYWWPCEGLSSICICHHCCLCLLDFQGAIVVMIIW